MKTDTKTKSSRLTTVKTIYARAAVLLLALNFCLTGYVVLNIADIQQEQLGELQKNNTTYSPRGASSTRENPQSTMTRRGAIEERATTSSTTEPETKENQ